METENYFFFVSHGSSHFHVLENATSLITISFPPWWKELVFLLFELFPPLNAQALSWAQRPSSQFLMGVRAINGPSEHREQCQPSKQHIHMARPGTLHSC